MLWAKKLEQVGAALKKDLALFLKTRIKDASAQDVAEDLVKTAIKADMSRSAIRLRRRLYAQWGKYDLMEGELYRLTSTGLQERNLLEPDPVEVGDLHIDPFRLISVVKMLGMTGKVRLNNQDRVKCVTLVLKTIVQKTRAVQPPLTERAVGVLMALHAVEADRHVPHASVVPTVRRFFGQWELPVPSDAEIEQDMATLVSLGAVLPADDATRWRVSERISYPW